MTPVQEITHLIGAIDRLRSEADSGEALERLRTLELCLIEAARRLGQEAV